MSKNTETVAQAKKEIEAAKSEADIQKVKEHLNRVSTLLDAVQI